MALKLRPGQTSLTSRFLDTGDYDMKTLRCTGEQVALALRPTSPLWPVLLCSALVVATVLFAIPGPLTWDSGTYHMMVRGLYETGSFFIPNGYEDLSSPLLAVGQTTVKHGHIVSQYPEFYTFLSLPFYALFGFRGLMVLNALAFGGTCFLLWRMSRWFSDHPNAPIAAVSIYALATYSIEFTQSSYPHLTSTFLICTSVWLVWSAALEKEGVRGAVSARMQSPEVRSALAGFVFAVAVGVRLDSVFAGLALAVPLVTARSLGLRPLFACAVGALLPFAALAWINLLKFGDPLPFSYGRAGAGGYTDSLTFYAPVALALGLGFALLVWHRLYPFHLTRRGAALLLILALAAVALTPFGRRLAFGVFQIVVDLRVRPEITEPALSRSAGGAVVYWGVVKKALLQSCPYLVLIVPPALRGLLGERYGSRGLLWLVPIGFIGFYGYLAWHGSVGWNMRYLNPALPFLAILASHELLRIWDRMPIRRSLMWAAAAAVWLGLVRVFMESTHDLQRQEHLLLNGGLILAGFLLVLRTIEPLLRERQAVWCQAALVLTLLFSFVWASALTFGVDYQRSSSVRAHFLNNSGLIAHVIEDNALIITFQPDYLWPLLGSTKSISIANEADKRAETDAAPLLAERALKTRPVYWLASPQNDPASSRMAHDLRSRGIEMESKLNAAAGWPYHLVRLTKGE